MTKPHLFGLHSQTFLKLAIKNAQRTIRDKPNALTTVVLSCMSIEAFMHEMAYLLKMPGMNNKLVERGKLLEAEIEDEEKHFRERFTLLIPDNKNWAQEPFSHLELLVKLRNRVVHLDHVDKFKDSESDEIEIPENVQALAKLGITAEVPEGAWLTWFDIIQTPELAWWACKTIRDSVIEILITYEKDFADYFKVWREIAAMDLPIKDAYQLVEETGLKICSFRGKTGEYSDALYEKVNGNTIIYSGITLNNTSTINAAEEVIERICEIEEINPSEIIFYDLQTHLGYSKKSSEYEITQVTWNPPKEPVFKSCANEIADNLQRFSVLIGRPAPF